MKISGEKSIILFDGVCNLCNSSVQFVLKRDKKNKFLFASLQSDAAEKLLLQFNIKNNELDSIVLIEGNKLYKKSTAALRIAKELGRFWNALYLFIVLPKFIRDWAYDFIAKNRYKWFGKKDSCMLFIDAYKEKFIA